MNYLRFRGNISKISMLVATNCTVALEINILDVYLHGFRKSEDPIFFNFIDSIQNMN